ncbi:hypothetical protein JD844_025947 [Phrynosoma platyrhinos]|uniref:Ciliogenesis and planar polarity effector 2 n=1 Tax=Phrynosoma platyrhinos TaxID=52577 RepID=A0ABQ7SQ06_PHRPL|nr:hypothetical protein JD844_025947 [Phrynosoma platyrhinos]
MRLKEAFPAAGIQTTAVFWPAKLQESGKALFFKFSFWDCGEAVLKKFDHILPSCLEKADGVLLVFSFTDRASFEDLPLQISRLAAEGPKAAPVIMAVGTKYPFWLLFDQFAHTDVTEQDVADFRRTWGLPVLRVKSVGARRTLDGRAALLEMAPFLNGLAERLWRRDQVAAGLLPAQPALPGAPHAAHPE